MSFGSFLLRQFLIGRASLRDHALLDDWRASSACRSGGDIARRLDRYNKTVDDFAYSASTVTSRMREMAQASKCRESRETIGVGDQRVRDGGGSSDIMRIL
jgi:hypothetical protein